MNPDKNSGFIRFLPGPGLEKIAGFARAEIPVGPYCLVYSHLYFYTQITCLHYSQAAAENLIASCGVELCTFRELWNVGFVVVCTKACSRVCSGVYQGIKGVYLGITGM